MADRYAALTGSATSPYETWAKSASLLTIASVAAAGDRVFVDVNHSQSLASWAMAWAGTPANPIRIYVVDRTGDPEPPTEANLTTGATLTQTGNGGAITGCIYVYGLYVLYTSNSSTTFSIGSVAGDVQLWEEGGLQVKGTGSATRLAFGTISASQDSLVKLRNMDLEFGAVAQRLGVNGKLIIEGGGFVVGTAAATGVLDLNNGARGGVAMVDGVDLSQLATGFDLVTRAQQASSCLARNCKLPSGWTGDAAETSTFVGAGSEVTMYQCGNTFDELMIRKSAWQGQMKNDPAVYGSTAVRDSSWFIVTSADASYPTNVFSTPEMLYEVHADEVDTELTLEVEIITETLTFHNEEVWLDLDAFDAVSGAAGSRINTRRTPLASATNWPTSTTSWVGEGGLTTPVKQKLAVSFTPTRAGQALVKLNFARPGAYLWVDMTVRAV